MESVDLFKVSGSIFLDLFDRNGNLKDFRDLHNVITSGGKRYMVDALMKTESGSMRWIGIGTGSLAAATGQNALQTEVGTRASGTITDNGKTYTVVLTFGSGNPAGGGAIKESGLFATSGGASMGSRQVFAVINKATSDSLKVTWRWVFS